MFQNGLSFKSDKSLITPNLHFDRSTVLLEIQTNGKYYK